MKRTFCALVLVFVFYSLSLAQETINTQSAISSVTVYPDSALITRQAELKLAAGSYSVIFPQLIPNLDENSLRVNARGDVQVKILGAEFKKEFLEEEAAQKVKQLQEQLQGLQDQKRALDDNKLVLAEERKFLDSVQLYSKGQIPKELVTRMPKAQELDDTLKFLGTRIKENYLNQQETDIKIRDLLKKIDALNRELRNISGPGQKMVRSAKVDLELAKSGSFELDISYLVRGASWQPVYDARADFDKTEVELVSYGIVSQTTGEDWNDVKLSLSTAKPSIGGRMPYVSPWFIRPYQPPVAMEKRSFLGKGQMVLQSMAFDNKMDEMEGVDAAGAPIEVYAAAEERGVAVVYALPRKATVKTDGSENKLPVSSQMLGADFEYSAYPRLAPHAYLGSRVTNAKDLQLLAGRVNVFLQGDYVGSSSIDNIGPQEEFDLYLGTDDNVKIKREEVERKVDDLLVAGIPSPTRKTTYKYKLTVENYKNRKIRVNLFDAIPVSQDEKIRVKINNVSLEPKDKDWENRKGIWRWELELAPKEKQEIFYTFIVESGRDVRIEGI